MLPSFSGDLAGIDAACREFADPALALKYARFFREGYDAYGVDHKNPRWVQRIEEWRSHWTPRGPAAVLELGRALFATGKYEHGAVAILLMKPLVERIGAGELPGLAAWLALVRNWGHCDVICGELIAPCIASGAIAPVKLKPWARSPDRFVRRAAPVSLLGALRRGPCAASLLPLLRPLMSDSERVVHQGMGWFLRELWKREPEPVEQFLSEWKDTAPRLIFQYATEKMDAAGKARFRRTKPAAPPK
jgi:3-methyladenine DNA glycosylase AlkD